LSQPRSEPKSPLQLGIHASGGWEQAPHLPNILGPLLPTWSSIAEVFLPLLHPSSLDLGLRAAVLLEGPLGSGRRTAARAAAAALGVNYIPVSCIEIRVSK
jgi:hypothetical protein